MVLASGPSSLGSLAPRKQREKPAAEGESQLKRRRVGDKPAQGGSKAERVVLDLTGSDDELDGQPVEAKLERKASGAGRADRDGAATLIKASQDSDVELTGSVAFEWSSGYCFRVWRDASGKIVRLFSGSGVHNDLDFWLGCFSSEKN